MSRYHQMLLLYVRQALRPSCVALGKTKHFAWILVFQKREKPWLLTVSCGLPAWLRRPQKQRIVTYRHKSLRSIMSPRRALFAIHLAAVLFGLAEVFGELIQSNAAVITLGRAVFVVAALALFARASRRPMARGMTGRKLVVLAAAGLLLALHWVTFFVSVNVGGITVATLGFASFPAFITLFEALALRQRVASVRSVL